MANYLNDGNRWTVIYQAVLKRGGGYDYRKLPFELVRFNTDTNPDAPEEIIPTGEREDYEGLGITATPTKPTEKVYERIWIVDGAAPFSQKTGFGAAE